MRPRETRRNMSYEERRRRKIVRNLVAYTVSTVVIVGGFLIITLSPELIPKIFLLVCIVMFIVALAETIKEFFEWLDRTD